MEIVGQSLADRAATVVVDGTLLQFRYMLDYKENISNLRHKLHDLQNAKARVGHQVEEATRGLEEIEGDVLKWISRADVAILNVDSILAEDGAASNTCCAGRLPNFKNRYKLSKQAKLEAPVISELAEMGAKFGRVSYRVPLHHHVLPCNDYEPFRSRESTLNSIMDALRRNRDAKDDDLIGVWGLGGVGKTTLAKQVGQRIKEEGVFQLVITVEVHPKADVKIIQERLAEWVEIKKEVEPLDSIELRAGLLQKRLLQEKSILVILDDVWDAIDLKKVGIPIGGDINRCTVLVTTRDEAVLSQMSVQEKKRFQLNVLRDDEAWELFRKMVGDLPEDRHIIATQIVKRCGGLPILLLPVATALKNKPLHTWEDALQRLESGLQKNGDGMQALAYSALELSCSHLGSDQKSLFLFCGLLMPQGISIEDMVRYVVGLSLFKDCSTVKTIRSRVLTLLGDLTSSCLLMEGDNHTYFTMHDVVHSFVRGYRDDVFSPEDFSEIEDWPDKHALEQLTAISLRYCQLLTRLPAMLECPKLKVFLSYKPPSIPGDIFFDAVEELRVLDISAVHLSPLPSLLRRLQSLQTLCLDRCIIEDVAMIGNILQLKILSLAGSNIVHLPKEIGKLDRLQLLDLRKCMELKKISPGVLSSLTHLEELYMRDSFTQWGLRDKTDGQQVNADLAELKDLKKLTTLEIGITDVTNLPDDLFSDKLERFFIVIGDCWGWARNDDVSATLKVKLDARIRVLKKVNVLLKKADDLHLDNSVGVKDVNLPELNMEGFGDRLRNLRLLNFHEVRYLVNSVQRGSRIVFPRLESLVIKYAKHLDKICNSPLAKESLGNLKQIKVSGCDAMSNLFPLSVARCLSKLEDIEVTYCEKMEGMFIMDDKRDDKDEKIYLGLLQKLTLEQLPRLENILSPMTSQDTREDAFFSDKIVFPNIQYVKVFSIRIRKMWNSEFSDSCTFMRNLVTLKIDGCKFIKDVFPVSMVNRLVQLQNLEIRNCPLLQEIIVPEKKHGEENKIYLPKLEVLFLRLLHSLETVCTGDLIECPNLLTLRIEDCPQLKSFIRSSSRHHRCDGTLFDSKVLFPNLEGVTVIIIDSLIKLWDEELHQDSFTKLKFLVVRKASSLTELFSSDMLRKVHTLETLTLDECDSLETIFDLHDLIRREAGKYPERISMLTNMTVVRLPNLKHVWLGDPHRIFSFQFLRLINFSLCTSLESLIPASIAQQLPQLEHVELVVSSLEHIIHREGTYYEQQDIEEATFEFPRLERIQIWHAPRLSSFYPGQHTIDWPELKHVSIMRCPKLEVFKSELEIASQVPQEAQLDNLSPTSEPLCSFLEMIIKSESASSSDQGVQMMQKWQMSHPLFSTDELLTKLELASSDRQLQIMQQWESSMSQPLLSIEEVLTKLESVCLSNQKVQIIQELELPDVLSSTLKEVHFDSFDGESVNLPINFLERFPNLEKIVVTHSDFVELFTCEILYKEKENMPLSRIQHLDLLCLTKLEHIWNPQSNLIHILDNLLTLQVMSCHSLVHLAPPFASFCNLTTLEVCGCQSLVSLFTFSTTTSLVQLREITVAQCEKLTEIIAVSDDETEREVHICFYKLEILKLSELGSITSFCSENNATLKFPLLAQLMVQGCPNMDLFYSGYLSAPKLKTVWQGTDRWKGDLNNTIRQLYNERVLPKSELVSLSNQYVQALQELEVPDELSTQKEVHFDSFDGESVPIEFFEKFPNLEKITATFSDFVELFTYEILDEEKENMQLSRIQHLDLRDLTKLEHIWNQQSKLDHVLNNLLTLRVWSCDSLVHLAPPFASFCNLRTLNVFRCQSLVSLFSFSTTTSLVQLREITVAQCEKLTEIIAVSDEETEREAHICFNKLEILKLSELGSITSFCSNATLKFPLLAELIVEDCPNMELFSLGYLSAPKLKTVWHGTDRWKGDLNTTIRQLYTERRLAAEEEEKASESSQP